MVQKRTVVFITLAAIVWACSATTLAEYYYLQNGMNADRMKSAQDSLNHIAANYTIQTDKYDLLLSDYALLHGNYSNYSYLQLDDYTALMPQLRNLIINLGGNYSDLYNQGEMNKPYTQLWSDYRALAEKVNISKTDFGNVLNESYDLLSLSAFRELGHSLSEATTLSVDVEIDYGNETVEWHNRTQASAGQTLFGVTQKIAIINYTDYAYTELGHILIDAIDNVTAYTDQSYKWGYSWIWYYRDDTSSSWVSGPVGCDAWLLKNGGTYKWSYEHWSYP